MAQVTNTYYLKDVDGTRSGNDITQTESAIVQFDSVVTTVLDAIKFSGFKKGQQHRSGKFLYLNDDISASVHQESNASTWLFELTYSTSNVGSSDNSDPNTGTYRPEVELGKWSYTRVVDRDKVTGLIIANTAGDPPDPLPIETISAPTISVTIQEFSPNMGRLDDIGSINSAELSIAGKPIPKYCGMFDDYSTKPFWDEEGYLTFRNTFVFKLKFFKNKAGQQIGFTLESASQGFNFLDTGNANQLTEIQVADPNFPTDRKKDVPVANPMPLDINGQSPIQAGYTEPAYQEFVVNDVVDFTTFGLPTAYPVN
jgi:hypothetical protein